MVFVLEFRGGRGLRQNAFERKKAPKGLFSTTYRLRVKPVDLYLERETRLASGLRAVEIYRFSAIPETGTALILDSLLPDGKIGTAARQPPYLSSSMLLERLLVSIR